MHPSAGLKTPRFLGLALLVPIAAAAATFILRPAGGTVQFRPDAQFARDPGYRAAMETARSGDLAGAAAAFGRLADSQPGSELGAWSRYQQAIGLRSLRRPAEASAAFERVRADYPSFFLAGRAEEALRAGRSDGATERQREAAADCGPRALLVVCERLEVPAKLAALRHTAGTKASGTTLEGLAKAAKSLGLKAAGVQMDRNAMLNLNSPAVAWVDGSHYISVLEVRGDRAKIRDPNRDRDEEMTIAELQRRSGGILLVVTR